MTNRQSTHAADCWGWGPKHYECAVAEIERLREQLRLATVDQAIAEAEASDAHAEIEQLRAEVVKLRNLRADAIHECALANIRAERLAEALRDAATSLQTIADKADLGACTTCRALCIETSTPFST